MRTQIKSAALTVETDTAAGQLTSIKDANGGEYLWQGDAAYWSGQAPMLFPIVGNLRGGTGVTQSGVPLKMSRHGVVRGRDFVLVEHGVDHAVYAFEADDLTLAAFPFRFRAEQIYTVKDTAVTVTYVVYNHGKVPLPFQLGGHPGFNCPLFAGEDFTDYSVLFEHAETVHAPAMTPDGNLDMTRKTPVLENSAALPLAHSLFYNDALILTGLKSRRVTMQNAAGHGVRVDFPGFDYLLLWSAKNDGPFLCIEPWSGLPTASDEDDIF